MATDMRPQRALQIATQSGQVERISEFAYKVKSQSGRGDYSVIRVGDEWKCECPDFTERKTTCKHIYACIFLPTVKTQVSRPTIIESENPKACIYCKSEAVVKRGFAREKGKKVQRFWCKTCNKTFVLNIGFKGMKNDPKAITAALDGYFRGLSLRDVRDHLAQFYGVKVHETSVLRWIAKYSNVISQYVDTLSPQLSETWHADEVFQKMRGGIKYKGDSGMAFLWNVMDRKTRFLIASKLSERRDREGAIQVFKEAAKNAHESQPENIFTDSLKAYREAMTSFCPITPEHVEKAGITKPHANNNRIERQNGTQRERFKVQRGWKSMETAIPEGNRIFYNFIRPHMALEEQTPAQAAGINLELEGNKWMQLIKMATKPCTTNATPATA